MDKFLLRILLFIVLGPVILLLRLFSLFFAFMTSVFTFFSIILMVICIGLALVVIVGCIIKGDAVWWGYVITFSILAWLFSPVGIPLFGAYLSGKLVDWADNIRNFAFKKN